MNSYKFPSNFLFGVANSAEQSEGKKDFKESSTNWNILYDKDKNLFYNQVGSFITNDTINNYKNDLLMLKEIGINSYRTSFSWAKIFPKPNHINKEALTFYHNYIDQMIKNKFKVMMCLNHFDIPDWVVEMGGFENKKTVNYFLDYAKLIIAEFAHKIDYLSTFNEPIVPIQAGYLGMHHWPQIVDNKRAVQAAYGTILSHSVVVDYFNKNWKNKIKTQIGIIVNISPALPKDNINFSIDDKKAADTYNLLHNYALLDAMAKGEFSEELISLLKKENILPEYTKEEIELIKTNKIDFIGTNYYNPFRVCAPSIPLEGNGVSIFNKYAQPYLWDKAIMNKSRGWEILPEMILNIATIIKERYNNIPFYISENGIGIENEEKFRNQQNKSIDDKYRCAFINEHLNFILKSIHELNVNCFGYHVWTGIDCWSWMNAYKNRYGLIELNLTDNTRKFKTSAFWFKKIIESKETDKNILTISHYLP